MLDPKKYGSATVDRSWLPVLPLSDAPCEPHQIRRSSQPREQDESVALGGESLVQAFCAGRTSSLNGKDHLRSCCFRSILARGAVYD